MSNTCKISFTNNSHSPVEVKKQSNPSEVLTRSNGPVLFGCKTGICGICTVEVQSGADSLTPATNVEKEVLGISARGNIKARLACQLSVVEDIEFKFIGK